MAGYLRKPLSFPIFMPNKERSCHMREDMLTVFDLTRLGRRLEGLGVGHKEVALHFRETRQAWCPRFGRKSQIEISFLRSA